MVRKNTLLTICKSSIRLHLDYGNILHDKPVYIQFTQNLQLSVALPFKNYMHIDNPIKYLYWSVLFSILCNPGTFRTLPHSEPEE